MELLLLVIEFAQVAVVLLGSSFYRALGFPIIEIAAAFAPQPIDCACSSAMLAEHTGPIDQVCGRACAFLVGLFNNFPHSIIYLAASVSEKQFA